MVDQILIEGFAQHHASFDGVGLWVVLVLEGGGGFVQRGLKRERERTAGKQRNCSFGRGQVDVVAFCFFRRRPEQTSLSNGRRQDGGGGLVVKGGRRGGH